MKKLSVFLASIIISTLPSFVWATPVITADYHSLPLTLFSFFGVGILLAFTPCVLPMVPILSGILAGQEKPNHFRSFQLSLSFVLGMTLTYTLAGIAAGYLGSTIQSAMQSPWIIASFSGIFILMALSMFGLFDLKMPRFLLNRAYHASQEQKSGTRIGALIMGVLSTLIASPCVTAPMVSTLTYIGQTGNALIGGLILFVLALGMGLPLLLFGMGQGALLPKVGIWMNTVKHLFGIMMVGMALWMLSRILPGTTMMLLWALLLIITSIAFGALSLPEKRVARVLQGVSFSTLVYGILLFVGAASGHDNLLIPLQPKNSTASTLTMEQLFIPVSTMESLEHRLIQAKTSHQPVMLDFYATWCPDCRAADRDIFSNSELQQEMQKVKAIRVDVTQDNVETKKLKERFHIYGVPSIVFINKNGNIIKSEQTEEITLASLKQQLQQVN